MRQNINVMMKIVLFDERQFYIIVFLWVFTGCLNRENKKNEIE